MADKLTAAIILEYQNKVHPMMKIKDYKQLGRDLRDRFDLTDIEALDLMNGRNVLEIMARHEND